MHYTQDLPNGEAPGPGVQRSSGGTGTLRAPVPAKRARPPFRLGRTPRGLAVLLTPTHVEVATPPGRNGQAQWARVELPDGCFGAKGVQEFAAFEISDEGALIDALIELQVRFGRPMRQVHLALDGTMIRQLSLPLPFVPEPAELKLAVQTEAERYVLFAGTEVALDATVLGQEGDHLAVLFAGMRQDLVLQLHRIFAAAALHLHSIEPASLALLRELERQVPRLIDGGEAVEQIGVACLLSRKLDVSDWERGELRNWRRIFLDDQAVRREDPYVISEAQFELQRTLTDMPARHWVVYDLPAPLVGVLQSRPDSSMETIERPGPDAPSLQVLGAAQYAGATRGLRFNLFTDRTAVRRSMNPLQLALLGGFGGIMAVALAINMVLGNQVKGLERAIQAAQSRAESLTTEVARAKAAGNGSAAARDALNRTRRVAHLFSVLRDTTPENVWLTDVLLGQEGTLVIEGYTLDRDGAVAFARALTPLPGVVRIGIPELSYAPYAGSMELHFKLEATLETAEAKP